MALSGSFSSYPVSGFGLYVSWSASQNIFNNTSTITYDVYLRYYTISVGARSGNDAWIDDNMTEYDTSAITHYAYTDTYKKLYTRSYTFTHHEDGTRNCWMSAAWSFNGNYSGVYVGTITASTTVTLNQIDRTAPAVSFSVSNIGTDRLTINATSNVNCDRWDYSLDYGTNFINWSTALGLSSSRTVTGLSPNTWYGIKVRARKTTNHIYGWTAFQEKQTIGNTILNSVNDFFADVSSPSFTFNWTVYSAAYSHVVQFYTLSNAWIMDWTGQTGTVGTANKTISLSSSQRTTMLNLLANVQTLIIKMRVITYSGATQVGSVVEKNVVVKTSLATSRPTITDIAYQDNVSEVYNVTGSNQIIVQNASNLWITGTNGSARNGANLTTWSASFQSLSASAASGNIAIGIPTQSGTHALTVTLTDSRGYSTSYSKNITVLAYTKPQTTMFVRRTNGVDKDIQLDFSGSVSSIKVSNVEKNSVAYVKYQYRCTDTQTWGSEVDLLPTTSIAELNYSYDTEDLMDLDPDKSYWFRLIVKDAFGSVTSNTIEKLIPQGIPLISVRRGKVGINTNTPEVGLDVYGGVQINGFVPMTRAGTMSADDDLSDITGTGIYINHYNAYATTARHYPCTSAGLLEVINGENFIYQRYTSFQGGMYYRCYYQNNSTWYGWFSNTYS